MSYKLTIDINLLTPNLNIPAMEKLKKWQSEGKLDLVHAHEKQSKPEPYTWPGAKPPPRPFGRAGKLKKEDPTFSSFFPRMAAVLFPQKNPDKLAMMEINDVVHLVRHHISKNEFFVTENSKNFIEDGKREQLQSSFGVITATPNEVVELLKKSEGWK